MKQIKPATVIDYLEIIIRWRYVIVRNVLIITVLAAIISFFIVNKYTATSTILPPGQDQSLMLGIMSAGLPGGLSNIPGISSFLPGLATPSDLYAAILRSGRIRSAIIRKHDLQRVFRTKTMHDTYEMLNELTSISVDPVGIITVSVTYKDKNLAAAIANSYVEELDRFNTETAMTTGKKYRIFIEARLKENKDSLSIAEETLRKFQEVHKITALEVEVENAILAIAELKSQIISLEVKKGMFGSSPQLNNPYFNDIEKELKELKRQLKKIEFGDSTNMREGFGAGFSVPFSRLPEVTLEYMRLYRNVKVQEAIYEQLTQQYEQAKIMEAKDTPTVQILDHASPPEKKSSPRRSIIVILVFLSAIAIHILVIFAWEYIKEEREKEKSPLVRLIELLGQVKLDFTKIVKKFKK